MTSEKSNSLASETSSDGNTITSAEGRAYKIEQATTIKPNELPTNSDFKMADKDITKYARKICGLDAGTKGTPIDRCDVFVQPDIGGTIIGYAALIQDPSGVRLESALQLNEKKVGLASSGCGISGDLYTMDGPRVTDASKDFVSQISYSAWEKTPGNWLVTTTESDGNIDENSNAAFGTWYIKRTGDKLQINQERWNYCYPSNVEVNIDDIFYRVLTLNQIH
ncbi:hypothetical protein NSE01_24720 [Novosphingobium sediminis]|uniref:Uncharacterized protein n=1 Tax=Novosphingobium sediminis TaxID=707214 RepID=A0A512ALQ1_9SPHN|nr:hypothetical protein NSE01_24720 [Novosphingobium sediminis]